MGVYPGYKPGTWRIIVNMPRKGTKREYETETFYGSKSDAEKRDTEIKRERDLGRHISKNQLTLGAYLEDWIVTVKIPAGVRPGVIKSYREHFHHLEKSGLEDCLLKNLTTKDLQAIVDALRERGRADNTIKNFISPLTDALNWAVKKKLIKENPASDIVRPTTDRSKLKFRNSWADEDAEDETPYENEFVEIWPNEIVEDFLQKLKDEPIPHSEAFELAIQTGLRRSELAGLRWSAVDLVRRELTVRRGRHDAEGGYTSAPKTKKGTRRIDLSPETVGLLERIQSIQNLQRMEVPGLWPKNAYVISKPDGTTTRVNYLTQIFKKYIRDHGFPEYMTFHKLRHVHGTMLMEDGWEPKEIMERLGHSSITVTMNIYAHIRRGSLREKVDRLDRLFRTN